MRRPLLLLWVLSVCALPGAACTGATNTTTGSLGGGAGPPPTNYRQIVRDYVRQTFKDPYSVRDAEISPPKMTEGPTLIPPLGPMTMAWVVCIRANAKNAFGAYTGLQQTAVVIYKDRAVNSWDEQHHSAYACRDSKYEPFPEIMSMS